MNDTLSVLIETFRVEARLIFRAIFSRRVVPVASIEVPYAPHTNHRGERVRTTSRCAWN